MPPVEGGSGEVIQGEGEPEASWVEGEVLDRPLVERGVGVKESRVEGGELGGSSDSSLGYLHNNQDPAQ